ncbi:MAG TPA: hypothetical protein VFU22_32420 [Roseiflexaceae bacterium]|nr:hypothetical protein [Roseiflexaceae bacterium]
MATSQRVAGPSPSELGLHTFSDLFYETLERHGEQAALELVQKALAAVEHRSAPCSDRPLRSCAWKRSSLDMKELLGRLMVTITTTKATEDADATFDRLTHPYAGGHHAAHSQSRRLRECGRCGNC